MVVAHLEHKRSECWWAISKSAR